MIEYPDIPWVVIDTETSGGHPDDGGRVACVALAHEYEDGTMWSVGLPFDQGVRDKIPNAQMGLDLFGGGETDPNLPREEWDRLLAWLSTIPIIMHNGKFDCMMMRAGTRHWPGIDLIRQLVWDTMVAQRVLDPTEDVGLDVTLQRLGLGAKKGIDGVKSWLKANKYPTHRYDLVPWDVIHQYVVADAEQTASLYRYQQRRLFDEDGEGGASVAEPELLERIEREWGLLYALYRMEERGVSFNTEESLAAAERLTREADELEKQLPFDPKPNAIKAYYIGQLGLLTDRTTSSGAPSIDEQQRRDWIKQGIPWVRELDQIVKKRKAVSMWYEAYPRMTGVDGRLRTSYKQTRVKSGRMSVGRVQLQAMPKEVKSGEGIPPVRQLIVPAEGKALWNLDLSQAELRVASRYSKCVRMLEMLEAGVDQHAATTEEVILRNEGRTRDELSKAEWKLKRDIGKRLNFSGIFQIGADHFQYILDKMANVQLPIEDEEDEDGNPIIGCRSIVYGWRRMYPEFGVKYKKADKQAANEGWVPILPKTPYEYRSYFGPRDFSNTAWNRIVQGSLAEFFKLWMIETERRWPGYLLLTVHDSFLIEALPDEGEQLCAEIAGWAVEEASNLFDIEMKVDVDRW